MSPGAGRPQSSPAHLDILIVEQGLEIHGQSTLTALGQDLRRQSTLGWLRGLSQPGQGLMGRFDGFGRAMAEQADQRPDPYRIVPTVEMHR